MADALIDKVLQDHLDFLQLELPARVFTREWKGRDRYTNVQLSPGIFTLIYKGSRMIDAPYTAAVKLLIIGRIYLGANASGLDVEQAELLMEDELRQYSEGSNGIALRIDSVVGSHQVETPHGWIVAECESGPHDLHHCSLFENGVPYDGLAFAAIEPGTGNGLPEHYQEIPDAE